MAAYTVTEKTATMYVKNAYIDKDSYEALINAGIDPSAEAESYGSLGAFMSVLRMEVDRFCAIHFLGHTYYSLELFEWFVSFL